MNDMLQVIINGLTYEGQTLHIIINNTLIVLVIMLFLLFDIRASRKESRAWLGCLAIAVIVQVAVWFAARAVGISVVGVSLIWCMMMGYLLIDYSRGNLGRAGCGRGLVLTALGIGCGGIVYYMVAFPAITTIAHLVAAGIGIGLFYLMRLIAAKKRVTSLQRRQT
jgi:membrane associated rhomboid family serine protease